MDYKELLKLVEDTKKEMSTLVSESKKEYTAVDRGLAAGDLRAVDKKIGELEQTLKAECETLSALKEKIASFDRAEYITSGTFKAQIVEECAAQKLDVKDGEGQVLEIFPNKLSINTDTQEITVDKKRSYCLNPAVIVSDIKKTQDKMSSAQFNEERFLKELSLAYEQCINLEAARKGKKPVRQYVSLANIYKMLAPTARAKKDYDMQSYAYDLSRIFNIGTVITKDGYKLEWNTNRDMEKNAIRILDRNGNEFYLKSIEFVESEY